jgi:diadenosine tetraphosphate (Ap4A) HIT family hydrolase
VTDPLEEFRDKYQVDRLTVCSNASWTWSVRTVQATLGAGMLSLHRLAPTLGSVTREEMADLADMLASVERTVTRAFHNDRINFIALMMTDQLAHMHFFPRFTSQREFAGHTWVDATWPNLPPLGGNRELSTPDVLDLIAAELRRLTR